MIIKIADINSVSTDSFNAVKHLLPKAFILLNKKRQLQTVLGRILLVDGIKELFRKENFNLAYNENGKPCLDFCFFSIAHRDEKVVVAISEKQIGVDLEKISPIKKRNKYKLFLKEENNYVNNSDNPTLDFYKVWTVKEAYIKALGGKLSHFKKINTVNLDLTLKSKINGFHITTKVEDDIIITICEK